MTKNIYQKTIVAFLIISFFAVGADYSNSAVIPSGDKESQISWAKERQEKLLKLMETNPQSVIDQSLPQTEIAKMPSYVKPYMEEVKTVSGTVFATVQDNFEQKTSKTSYIIKSGKERLPLYFAGEKPNLASGVKITIKNATQIGNKIVVPALTDLQKYSQTPYQQLAIGQKKAAIILFNFQDKTDEPFTKEQARAKVFDNANDYYKEVSFNKLSIAGYKSFNGEQDAYGWYTIPFSASDCQMYLTWADAAKKLAAEKDNFNETDYSNIMYFFPYNNNCRWGGLAQVGSLTSIDDRTYESWINGSTNSYIIAHELGHNFGSLHASSYTCYDGSKKIVSISNDCTASEYGDPFDVMGMGYSPNHMSSFNKTQLRWFDSQNIQTVEKDGTFTLFPIEKTSSGIQAIKIPRKTYSESKEYDDYYFLEYRRPYGYDNFNENDFVVNGISIRLVKSYAPINNKYSYLIDTTPSSSYNFNDAALLTGETFKDNIANIEIKTISVSSESAKIEIKILHYIPETPANFKAQQGECNSKSIILTWDDVENESYYTLNKRGSAGDDVKKPMTLPQDTISYIDKNIRKGYIYYYDLKACNRGGCSAAASAGPVKTPSECEILKALTINREGDGFGKVIIINKSDNNKKTICDLSSQNNNKCEYQYPEKSKLKLRAQNAFGSVFKNWTGGCSGTLKTCNIIMLSDIIVGAVFAKK